MNANDYVNRLKGISFYRDIHPEYLPFVGEKYDEYKVLHIGESHYIPNKPEEWTEDNGIHHNADEITLKDFDGWWDGNQSEKLNACKGWYNTQSVVNYYMNAHRSKGHGIFTNTLKAFCGSVIPDEAFESISETNSKKYNYFAFMNFFQMPSIYYGKSFTNALYSSGKRAGFNGEYIDSVWYKCMEESVKVVEDAIEALEPRVIIITSADVWRYYRHYGKKIAEKQYAEGILVKDERIIPVDHPGSSWWNRKKKCNELTSKEKLENSLKKIYENSIK